MSAAAHRLIARRDLPGYHPQNWCAVCGKATSRNAAFVSCEDDSCQNLCHTSCLGDTPVYRCEYTEQLRAQAGIPDPVTHFDKRPDILPPPHHDDQGRAESRWEELEKAELISLVEKLTEEAFQSNIIIKSLKQDRDLIIQNREVFASALKLVDKLIASKQREAEVTTRTQAVSALSDTIDEHWEEVCQDSDYWRAWWASGKPRQLRYTAERTPPPAHPGNPSPTPAPLATTPTTSPTPTATAATGTDNPPTRPSTTLFPVNEGNTDRHDQGTGPSVTSSPHPPPPVTQNTPSDGRRGGTRPKKGKNKKHKRPSQSQTVSDNRSHTSPQDVTQRPNQTPVRVCDYCTRRGHSAVTCHHRAADLRQERLLRQILAEGRYSAPPLPPAQPQPSQPQHPPHPRPLLPQQGAWGQGQGQGWQWHSSPHHYSYPGPLTSRHPSYHGLTPFPPPAWHVQGQNVPATN